MGKAEDLAALEALEADLAELAVRRADPIPRHLGALTPAQRAAFESPATYVLAIGGNQSGKTHWACLDAAAEAVGLHPWAQQQIDRKVAQGRETDLYHWYGITKYLQFGEQPWEHLKRFLLFEGESVHNLPTRRIVEIGWETKRAPEIPNYLKVRRADGGFWHLFVKPYEAGRKAFQAKTVDSVTVDEECDNAIFEEIQARGLANPGFKVKVALTPVTGRGWVRRLKRLAIAAGRVEGTAGQADPALLGKPAVAQTGAGSVSLHRFLTKENPAVAGAFVASIEAQWAGRPDDIKLRLEGEDSASSGLVYPDSLFTSEHVIDDLLGPRPRLEHGAWTFHRAIDAGFRHPACLWLATNARGRNILYRCWKGKDLRVADAWAEIARLSGSERYDLDLIDPEVAATTPETGESELAVWRKHGFTGRVAPSNRVWAGVEQVQDLMAARVEIPDEHAPGGSRMVPRLQVLASCREWLDEREEYKVRSISEEPEADEPVRRRVIVKRDDHLMDPMRLLVLARPRHVKMEAPAPPKGHPGRVFFEQREKLKNRGKRRL